MNISDNAVARLQRVLDEPVLPPRYTLLVELGRGGMGTVWRARDTELERDIAIKVLGPGATDPSFAQRLIREAQVLARLEHPGIVPVYDMGVLDDGAPWYAMRLVTGVRLDRATDLPRDEVLRIVELLCDTLAYAHANGVVHRDVTPANVMIGPFGEVLLLDWGLARPPGADAGVTGTPGYIAPEQRAGHADARSDVFALGAMLEHLLGPPSEPPPRVLRSIIARAIEPDAEARYPSTITLRDELRRFRSGDRVLAHRETPMERMGRVIRPYLMPIGLVAAYLVMRVLFLWWQGRG